MEKKEAEEQKLLLEPDGGIVGTFNRAIDTYSRVTPEELLEFLGALDEEETE